MYKANLLQQWISTTNFIRFCIYIGVFILLFSDVLGEDPKRLLFYAYLALIYYDCRDKNVRSLVVILAVLEFVFFELDYILYIIGKYYINTGHVVGDITLDILILICFVSLILSIHYRSEIMNLYTRLYQKEPFDYLPTRADLLQIYVIRITLFVLAFFMLKNAFLVNELNHAEPGQVDVILKKLKQHADYYIDVLEKMEFLRHLSIVLLLSPWSQQSLPGKKTSMTIN